MFRDRRDAGRRLADRLTELAPRDPVVVGMPRGGVPVAAEIADRLDAPLDIIVVRKLGCPWQPELALGAIAEGGVMVVDESLLAETGVGRDELEAIATRERAELERRTSRYRGDRPAIDVRDRTVILVDDGIATGSTARAAIAALRARHPGRLVMAAPVAAGHTIAELGAVADEVVVVDRDDHLFAIGEAYADFRATTDDEVIGLLQRGSRSDGPGGRSGR